MSDFYDDDALSAASTIEAFGDNEEDIFYAIYLYINNL
jgi:hypothetical protein